MILKKIMNTLINKVPIFSLMQFEAYRILFLMFKYGFINILFLFSPNIWNIQYESHIQILSNCSQIDKSSLQGKLQVADFFGLRFVKYAYRENIFFF